MTGRTLAVRLDSIGDVLLTGPALRALAGPDTTLDLLASPTGAPAARLLPGVDQVLTFDAPWCGYRPPAVRPAQVDDLVDRLRRRCYTRAVVFTSFGQSPLPMALLARLAGIERVAATSVDYPGSLLDVRHRRPTGHEVHAALSLARAAGGRLPPGDDGRLRVRRPLPDTGIPLPEGYVVLHPGASVPARAPSPAHAVAIASALRADGWPVVVTGGGESDRLPAAPGVLDLTGRTDLARLATVLDRAACLVSGNTGPAHLAAAVGTPVVSLFAPVVPAERWAPYGVPSVLLGDQSAPCRDTRARDCPVPGHPCLSGIPAEAVVAAVAGLAGGPPDRDRLVTGRPARRE